MAVQLLRPFVMSNVKLALHIYAVNVESWCNSARNLTNSETLVEEQPVTIAAEVIQFGRQVCQVRVPRHEMVFDLADVRVCVGWKDLPAKVLWTNTTEEYVELGIAIPHHPPFDSGQGIDVD